MTKTATTLVTGRWRGRISSDSIQIGSVVCWPAVKVVTITSSKESAKASMPPASSAVREIGQQHVAEGLEAVGAEIHRRLDQRAGGAPEPRHRIVVDDDDAEGRVAEHDRPEREGDVGEREGGAERDAGDDAGKRDRQDEEQRDRLAPEEARARHRGGGERAEHEREQRRDRGDAGAERERAARCPRAPRRRRTSASV